MVNHLQVIARALSVYKPEHRSKPPPFQYRRIDIMNVAVWWKLTTDESWELLGNIDLDLVVDEVKELIETEEIGHGRQGQIKIIIGEQEDLT